MATTQVTCEALQQTIFSLKENDEISHISFRLDDNMFVQFLDDETELDKEVRVERYLKLLIQN